MNPENKHNLIAWCITLVLHCLFLFIPMSNTLKVVSKESLPESIPINYVVKEIKVKKPAKAVSETKKIVKQKEKKQKKIVKKAPPKPTSMPGDRKQAAVSKTVEPYYPKSAINNSLEGTVVVDVVVNSEGAPQTVTIIRSSGHEMLDNAFVDTIVEGYSFKPKRVMGKNEMDSVRLKYTFEL